MNLVIVANDINLAIAFPETLLKVIQQLAEEDVVFLRPQDVRSLPGRRIERCSQIVLLILARGPDFKLRAFEHPLVADLGEEIDVEFIGEQNQLVWALVFDQQTNPRQSPGALRVLITAFELGAFPGVAGGFQLKSNGLARDFNSRQHGESHGQSGATPANSKPAQDSWRKFDQRTKHPLPATQAWRRLVISLPNQSGSAIGLNRAIDARSRAEEEIGDFSRALPGGVEEQNGNGEEMPRTGLAQFTRAVPLALRLGFQVR